LPTLTGLDILAENGFQQLRGKSIAVLCNQASVSRDLIHTIDLLLPSHRRDDFKIKAVFGPQHGLHGHTQDNMIEWEGALDTRLGIPIYSLYGEHREPNDEMLSGVELFVVDLQDLGARYYTFIWTMALCMRACERLGIPMLILDRPNPIGGSQTEGPLLDSSLVSFIGLHPLTTRHGMTIAEIAKHLQVTYYPKLKPIASRWRAGPEAIISMISISTGFLLRPMFQLSIPPSSIQACASWRARTYRRGEGRRDL